ncbi:MarR family winged helix-turn-helix transcriptional regulator [Mycolicibacterium sp. CBMA 226]|uniref:MarR family winged helix-turn-helix transcriptional regulator n=1 Tax=Mycolicibacterium sp. CBMA 226 TaxID=2606611 RepID=UPI001317FB38|nr:hypothetical protein ICEMyc226_00252 [Mycolicibacterium sp.]
MSDIDAPHATRIVDKLESDGLVERRPHPDDKRRKLVTLTPAGTNALTTPDAVLLRPPAEIGRLPVDALEQLIRLLTLLVDKDAATAPIR